MKSAKRIIEDEKLRDKILVMLKTEEFSVLIGCLKELGKRPSPASSSPEHALVLGALANAEVFGWSNCIEKAEYFDLIISDMMKSASASKNDVYDFGGEELRVASDPLAKR